VFAVEIEFLAGDFILDTPIVVLKLRVALLPMLVLTTVFVEAGDCVPGPISRRLPRLGIEVHGEGIIPGEDRAVPLQIVGVRTSHIHPDAYAFVANELHSANRLFNGGILLAMRSPGTIVQGDEGSERGNEYKQQEMSRLRRER
jgi:hypothetical protein